MLHLHLRLPSVPGLVMTKNDQRKLPLRSDVKTTMKIHLVVDVDRPQKVVLYDENGQNVKDVIISVLRKGSFLAKKSFSPSQHLVPSVRVTPRREQVLFGQLAPLTSRVSVQVIPHLSERDPLLLLCPPTLMRTRSGIVWPIDFTFSFVLIGTYIGEQKSQADIEMKL